MPLGVSTLAAWATIWKNPRRSLLLNGVPRKVLTIDRVTVCSPAPEPGETAMAPMMYLPSGRVSWLLNT